MANSRQTLLSLTEILPHTVTSTRFHVPSCYRSCNTNLDSCFNRTRPDLTQLVWCNSSLPQTTSIFLPWPVNARTFMGSSWPANWTSSYSSNEQGCSSVDSVPAFEAVGRRIDPSQWTQLQFGLFSVPTSGPQLVYQRPWYVLFCLWKTAYKRSLAAYRKE